MGNLYPLLMLPGFDPRPWGTLDLSPIYPNHKFDEKIGERSSVPQGRGSNAGNINNGYKVPIQNLAPTKKTARKWNGLCRT